MLINKTVMIGISGNNVKYWEDLGYKIERYKDKQGRISVKKGTKILVDVNDLPNGSGALIDCYCDGENCKNPFLKNISWCDYKKQVKENDLYYCKFCATELFAREKIRIIKLEKTISFENWCINNNFIKELNRWDYELNIFNDRIFLPSDISYGSNKYFYFKCPKELHESELKLISSFTSGQYGSLDCIQCNSIGQWLIDNNFEWGFYLWSDKNTNTLFDYYLNSHAMVWWKCENDIHDDYERKIYQSKRFNFRCPSCSLLLKTSNLQNIIEQYLSFLEFDLRHENKCDLICKNPETSCYLWYDNEIISDNFKLIIEIHGEQHYNKENGWIKSLAKKHNITPQQELEYTQWKDQYKKEYALSQGYYYLAIPYWTEKIILGNN